MTQITINIDNPTLSEETRFALSVMLETAAKQFVACPHADSEAIYTAHYGSTYTFIVQRCRKCAEVTVRLQGNTETGTQYLATLPTTIAPYATNRPEIGNAYYWRFDGLSHSTPRISDLDPMETHS